MAQETYLQRQQRLEAARGQVRGAYTEHLGRDASDDEVNSHLGGGANFNPDNVNWAINNIANSEEARNRRNAPPPAATTGASTTTAVTNVQAQAGPAHMATAASAGPGPGAPPRLLPSASRPTLAAPTGVGKAVVQPSSVYTPGQLGAKAQGPGFSQFTNPNAGQVPQLSQDLITNILSNPETMTPDVVNQLKSKGRDTALSMASQLRDGAHADVASRGFSDAGGMRAGFDRQIDSAMIDDIINSNRDIDLNAIATNRGDQLAAAGAGNDWENALAARADSNYRARLLGESTQSDDVYRGNMLDLDRFKTTESAAQASDASKFRNDEFTYGQMRDDRNQSLQEFLGQEGVNLDWARLDESADQFGQTFGEGKRQFNNNLGFNFAKLSADQQSKLMDQIDALLPRK